jgi:hypothetical protein
MSGGKKTTKKQMIVGRETYVNQRTGSVEEFNVIEQRDADFNFEKLWLGHLLDSLDIIGNKKIKVMNWLLKNRDSENKIIATQRRIAQETGVSLPTVNQTIDSMVQAHAIKQIQRGVLMLNPALIFKGSHSKRMNVLLRYNQVEELEAGEEEQLSFPEVD